MSARITPVMQQYLDVKDRHPDAIVFFRLGDFYEMFGDDAVTASRVLDITLTSREFGKGERIPMCGVPHHAAESYIATLAERGFKVAICEQLEDPRQAKGIVRRDVIRVVTPGTITLAQALAAKAPRLLAAICRHHARMWGVATVDASTGEFWVTQLEGDDAPLKVREELARLRPAEVLVGPGISDLDSNQWAGTAPDRPGAPLVSPYDPRVFQLDEARRLLLRHFHTESLHAFGVEDEPAAVRAAGAALAYLAETQRTSLAHVTRLVRYHVGDHMGLDAVTRRNLELTERQRDGRVEGSLLWVLDRTVTAMGGRLLRAWVDQPLLQPDAIEARLTLVDVFAGDHALRAQLRDELGRIADLERLLGRVASQTANARDLQALARSLERVPTLQAALRERAAAQGERGAGPLLAELAGRLDGAPEVSGRINGALADEVPATVREGGLIRDGFDPEVDRLRRARKQGRGWISALEEAERERTGIRSLKVGYNKVFGYYIEVTRPHLDKVPSDYQRRQTLRHAERFITPELKEQEALVLTAAEGLVEREYELFVALREEVKEQIPRLQATARAVAELDALLSLAEAAVEHGYVRPVLLEPGGPIIIRDGRHPVVEVTRRDEGFVANDTELAPEGTRLVILTGPNMAGKSTYLRQVALIVLMAQMGSFVPAAEAKIGLVDRIFTRIGAGDDVGSHRSTFMVEMNEAAHILLHATPRSLVLLDELGRGTSTYDGMALAQAIAEHLHDVVGAKVIFSTHYHELTGLERSLEHALNYHAAVQEDRGRISFLYRIRQGASDRSYGVNVARMAGIPEPVLRRARQLLRRLERGAVARDQPPGQLDFLDLFWGPEEEEPPSASEPPPLSSAGDSGEPGRTPAEEPASAPSSPAFRDGAGPTDGPPERASGPGASFASREVPAGGRAGGQAAAEAMSPAVRAVLDDLRRLQVEATTPLRALELIDRWQRQLLEEAEGNHLVRP